MLDTAWWCAVESDRKWALTLDCRDCGGQVVGTKEIDHNEHSSILGLCGYSMDDMTLLASRWQMVEHLLAVSDGQMSRLDNEEGSSWLKSSGGVRWTVNGSNLSSTSTAT